LKVDELILTAKQNFFASFINFKAISLSNRVLRAISSKSWRKWKVTLSTMMIFTWNYVCKNRLTEQLVKSKRKESKSKGIAIV